MAKPKYKKCALDGCSELFKIHGRQAYHHEDCRKEQQKRDKKIQDDHEVSMYKKAKALAKLTTGSAKNIGVNPMFTQRGKIHYEGYTGL